LSPPPFFLITSDTAEAPHFIFQAFPSISTGIYGYPIESAAQVALGEVRKFLETEDAKEACLVYVAISALRGVSLMVRVPRTVRARDLHGLFRGG
jgi:O-acetyl-ADP-ribose deacetylase (regulator of RNase III)